MAAPMANGVQTSKCKILCIPTRQNPPKSKYTFLVTELNQVESISYLGVTVKSNLKWSQHIASISANASKTLGLIRLNLWNCLKNVNESPYCSIVGPNLEYASASWDPHYKKDVHTLKRVQRKAARFYLQNFNRITSVTDMLRELEWDTLEMRRRKNRLTVMYKLSHSLVLKTSC